MFCLNLGGLGREQLFTKLDSEVSHAIVMEKGLGSGHLVLQICCFWQKVITYHSIPGAIYEGTWMGDLVLWSHTLILLMRKLRLRVRWRAPQSVVLRLVPV